MLLFLALVFPAVFAISGMFSGTGPAWAQPRDGETELLMRGAAEKAINNILAAEMNTGKTTAAILLSVDGFSKLEEQYGSKAAAFIMKQTAERLVSVLRGDDLVVRMNGPRFAVALGPVRRADLETLIQLSARLQATIAEPYSIDATKIYISISVGFCVANRAPVRSGAAMLEAAQSALETARANGNGSIRAYTQHPDSPASKRNFGSQDIAEALENGQIHPWFQPQVSTNTGQITGFEALARWHHPTLGVIPPADFLPTLQEMELLERLCEVVLSKSLASLRHWDKAGFSIPSVSVNFSSQELSNPKLVERLKWELDRFDLAPHRLCVEILEDVIAISKNDVIIRNIQQVAELGCRIDLDDFGTGHASIANIRRFSVTRIKIDRSFVTMVDRDRDQQNMVAAILTMAERLGIDTLAEGVETIGEHTILAQLGCGHVQGFSVARPMPFEDTEKWIIQHREKLPTTPDLGQKTG
ncbi:MAG: bifunctional diguanylate cyclase/phosphodiesterase [Paracoccaceae bacterium]